MAIACHSWRLLGGTTGSCMAPASPGCSCLPLVLANTDFPLTTVYRASAASSGAPGRLPGQGVGTRSRPRLRGGHESARRDGVSFASGRSRPLAVCRGRESGPVAARGFVSGWIARECETGWSELCERKVKTPAPADGARRSHTGDRAQTRRQSTGGRYGGQAPRQTRRHNSVAWVQSCTSTST